MYHRQIFFIFIIITVVSLFSFYRSAIKREKEIKYYRQLSLEKQNQDEQEKLNQLHYAEQQKIKQEKHKLFMERFLDFPNKSWDIQPLISRFKKIPICCRQQSGNPSPKTESEKASRRLKENDSPALAFFVILVLLIGLVMAIYDAVIQIKSQPKSNDDSISRRFSLHDYATKNSNRLQNRGERLKFF